MAGDPVQHIVDGLTPYIGAHMARSALLAHCQKLGIAGPDVSPEQVEKLVTRLESGLAIFLGREKTATVIAGIRESLGNSR
jgi:hypothetical protein